MKRKELIEKLLEFGDDDTEVSVFNCDIQSVAMLPAYWDGTLEKTERVGDTYKCKYVRHGHKIVLYSSSISDLVWDYQTEIDYSELNEDAAKRLKEKHKNIAEQAAEVDYECERGIFIDWVLNTLQRVTMDRTFSRVEDEFKIINDTDQFFRSIYKTYKIVPGENISWKDAFHDWLSNNYFVVYIYDKISVLKRGI